MLFSRGADKVSDRSVHSITFKAIAIVSGISELRTSCNSIVIDFVDVLYANHIGILLGLKLQSLVMFYFNLAIADFASASVATVNLGRPTSKPILVTPLM